MVTITHSKPQSILIAFTRDGGWAIDIETNSLYTGKAKTIKRVINAPVQQVEFPNDSAVAPYNIDSFVNHSVKWGNGIDTGSLGFAYVYLSVSNKGKVNFESIGGQGRDEYKIAPEYMKIEKINEKLTAIFSKLPNWKVKIKSKELHGIYYLTLRNK